MPPSGTCLEEQILRLLRARSIHPRYYLTKARQALLSQLNQRGEIRSLCLQTIDSRQFDTAGINLARNSSLTLQLPYQMRFPLLYLL